VKSRILPCVVRYSILVSCFLVLALGCTRGGDDEQPQDSGAEAEGKEQQKRGQDSGAVQFEMESNGSPETGSGNGSSADVKGAAPQGADRQRGDGPGQGGGGDAGDVGDGQPAVLQREAFLLPSGEIARNTPRDLVIGKLADPEAEEPSGAVLTRVERFFQSGEYAPETVLPSARTRFERGVATRWRRVANVRVGDVELLESGRAMVPVRLLEEPGRAEGEVYLERHEGAWYISDVFVDFSELETAAETRVFQPGRESPALTGP
jgi:hypothetical protein